jgi:hypothetical protein
MLEKSECKMSKDHLVDSILIHDLLAEIGFSPCWGLQLDSTLNFVMNFDEPELCFIEPRILESNTSDAWRFQSERRRIFVEGQRKIIFETGSVSIKKDKLFNTRLGNDFYDTQKAILFTQGQIITGIAFDRMRKILFLKMDLDTEISLDYSERCFDFQIGVVKLFSKTVGLFVE